MAEDFEITGPGSHITLTDEEKKRIEEDQKLAEKELKGGDVESQQGMGTKSIDWGKYMDGGVDFRKSYRYSQARKRNTGPALKTKLGDVYRNKKDFTFLGDYIIDSGEESLKRMGGHDTLKNLGKKGYK
jgi:hypothetical protein